MKQKINITDNLEYINAILSNISFAMTRSVAIDIFQEKIIDDIYYSDVLLKKITQIIEENNFFSKNVEIIKKIIDMKQAYLVIIEDLVRHSAINNENAIHNKTIDEIISTQNFEILKLKGIQRLNPGYVKHDEDLISPEEYRCLIM